MAEIAMPPDPAVVRLRSPTLRTRFPSDDPLDDDLLFAIEDAVAMIPELTGRALDDTLPARLRPIALRATGLLAEQFGLAAAAGVRSASLDGKRLRSFSAGSYSEAYFDPTSAAGKGTGALSPDAATHEALWALATDEKRAWWRREWNPDAPPEPFSKLVRPSYGAMTRY